MRMPLVYLISFAILSCSTQVMAQTSGNKNDYDFVFTKMEVLSSSKRDYYGWKKYVDTSLSRHEFYFPLSDSISKLIDSVVVRFIVSKDGKLSNYKIITGNNLFINNLAVELLKNSGKWHPGESSGRYLNSSRTLSMKFEIDYTTRSIKYLPSWEDYWRKNE